MDSAALLICYLLMDYFKSSFVAASAGALEFSIPFVVLFRVQLIKSHRGAALGTHQSSFKYWHGIDEDVAHGGQLLSRFYQELQQPVVLLKELFSVLKEVIIYLRC